MAAELATSLTSTDAERLEQAEALVRGYCRWHVAPRRSETVSVKAAGPCVLLVKSLHVTDVTEVAVAGEVVDAADYDWSEAGVLTRYSGSWPSRGSVEVTLTHGYDTVPPEVTAIVQAVAQRAVDNPGSKPREQAGPFADTYSQSGFNQAPALALLDAEKATLDRYRLPSLP